MADRAGWWNGPVSWHPAIIASHGGTPSAGGRGAWRGNPFSPPPARNCFAGAGILVANLREGQAVIDTH